MGLVFILIQWTVLKSTDIITNCYFMPRKLDPKLILWSKILWVGLYRIVYLTIIIEKLEINGKLWIVRGQSENLHSFRLMKSARADFRIQSQRLNFWKRTLLYPQLSTSRVLAIVDPPYRRNLFRSNKNSDKNNTAGKSMHRPIWKIQILWHLFNLDHVRLKHNLTIPLWIGTIDGRLKGKTKADSQSQSCLRSGRTVRHAMTKDRT